eukprot:TRINITY_DN21747_c0_g1_i1.p1 TRINITY_DN21747_c0_g1~~TRINITY_DN21747_c0_g1_i1.p1  ORF type:complete len:445 (+),score=51.78 TRINITY_DN21747_c0_g1_i1:128-1336(+)
MNATDFENESPFTGPVLDDSIDFYAQYRCLSDRLTKYNAPNPPAESSHIANLLANLAVPSTSTTTVLEQQSRRNIPHIIGFLHGNGVDITKRDFYYSQPSDGNDFQSFGSTVDSNPGERTFHNIVSGDSKFIEVTELDFKYSTNGDLWAGSRMFYADRLRPGGLAGLWQDGQETRKRDNGYNGNLGGGGIFQERKGASAFEPINFVKPIDAATVFFSQAVSDYNPPGFFDDSYFLNFADGYNSQGDPNATPQPLADLAHYEEQNQKCPHLFNMLFSVPLTQKFAGEQLLLIFGDVVLFEQSLHFPRTSDDEFTGDRYPMERLSFWFRVVILGYKLNGNTIIVGASYRGTPTNLDSRDPVTLPIKPECCEMMPWTSYGDIERPACVVTSWTQQFDNDNTPTPP